MLRKQKHLYDNIIFRQNFYLWMFISQEGLWDDAREFVSENMEKPIASDQARHIFMSNKSVNWRYLK